MSVCAHRRSCRQPAVYSVAGPTRTVMTCGKHCESAKAWAWNRGRVGGHVKCWRIDGGGQ